MPAKRKSKVGPGARSPSWMWDKLTSPEFTVAVKATRGTCLVPVGVMEVHGRHLPLGTDARLEAEYHRTSDHSR